VVFATAFELPKEQEMTYLVGILMKNWILHHLL